MKPAALFRLESRYIMPTYRRSNVVLEYGRGAYVYDADGNKYLDFISGIATAPLGHSNPQIVSAIKSQASKLMNVTNLFYTEPQVKLAKKLVSAAGFNGKVFFSNSGTEAVETAIKLARKCSGKTEIIATEHAFHGRTLGALSATWKEKIRKPFKPLVPDFKHIKYDDADALAKAITKNTAAFIVEPIQGEAGVAIPSAGYLKKVSKICSRVGALLIVDEIQTGLGRTGKFFAFQHEGIKPDIVTMAKGLAGGVPIGATLAKSKVANAFERGDHGSTFGGNSFATAVADSVVGYICQNRLWERARKTGEYFIRRLESLKSRYGFIREIRGKGLMIGVELNFEGKEIVDKCIEYGLLINCATEKTLRFLPPLIITKKEVDRCVEILDNVFSKVSR